MLAILTLLIAGVAAIASFLPSTGKVYDNSNRVKGLKRMKLRGWWTLGLFCLVLALTWTQNWLNEKEQYKRENAQKRSFDSTLAAYKKQTDLSNRRTILDITKTQTEILGKYGFKLDSANNTLVKAVRDSSAKQRSLIERNYILARVTADSSAKEKVAQATLNKLELQNAVKAFLRNWPRDGLFIIQFRPNEENKKWTDEVLAVMWPELKNPILYQDKNAHEKWNNAVNILSEQSIMLKNPKFPITRHSYADSTETKQLLKDYLNRNVRIIYDAVQHVRNKGFN